MTKHVYQFDEGNKGMRSLLGGKGANLAEMTNIGLPVPPGFTVSTEACKKFYKMGQKIDESLKNEILDNLSKLEEKMGKKLGKGDNPLLISVRSGAPISMPGMMDTILNLGLNDESVKVFAEAVSSERTAYDSYRRLIQMYGNVVMKVDMNEFEGILEEAKKVNGYQQDTELTVDDLKKLVDDYKVVFKKNTGIEFPQDSVEQLMMSVEAVFSSWENDRAIAYRNINNIPHDL